MKRFTLSVTLLEDLHTGSGTGAGDFDALLARDSRNLPVIPASHWLGVLRDNLSRYLHATDSESRACDALFGKTNGQRGGLTATALYCPAAIQTEKKAVEALAWTSTSREQESRVPKENTLRTKEFIPAGTRFVASLWLADDALEDMLRTACRITDRLGARRQRGDGLIKVSLKEREIQDMPITDTVTTATLRLLLKAQDPICLPKTGTPGNIIESECYLRGQVVRGAFIAWLLRQQQGDTAKLWLGSNIQVSNAYPLPKTKLPEDDGWLSLDIVPMPLHIGFPKPAGSELNGLPWWAMANNAPPPAVDQLATTDHLEKQTGSDVANKPNAEKLKRPADGDFLFSKDNGSNWRKFTSNLAQRMRNSPASSQQPNGALFTQEEISEQTQVLCEIQFPDNETAKKITKTCTALFSKQDCLTMGRGGAPVTIEKWASIGSMASQTHETADTLKITLTSDLIARSPTLGFYQSITPQVLYELCGVELSTITGKAAVSAIMSRFMVLMP
jgi:CRISPR/Cas system CSM-associated protein Csm3 (group 7 of RAMP superfamily)